MADRFWEIDLLRGLAVVGMIIYHLFYDLDFFGVLGLPGNSTAWYIFPRVVAGIFIFLVGVSLYISYSRSRNEMSQKELWRKYLKRGVKIFLYGLLISAVTWLFLPQSFIVFGVLHFIGVSIILGYIILRSGIDQEILYTLASGFVLGGFLLRRIEVGFTWLMWLGITPESFQSLDFFPVFPWFGVVLLGIYMGRRFYSSAERNFSIRGASGRLSDFFTFLGRNSLEIYFIHQPVLIGLIYLLA